MYDFAIKMLTETAAHESSIILKQITLEHITLYLRQTLLWAIVCRWDDLSFPVHCTDEIQQEQNGHYSQLLCASAWLLHENPMEHFFSYVLTFQAWFS